VLFFPGIGKRRALGSRVGTRRDRQHGLPGPRAKRAYTKAVPGRRASRRCRISRRYASPRRRNRGRRGIEHRYALVPLLAAIATVASRDRPTPTHRRHPHQRLVGEPAPCKFVASAAIYSLAAAACARMRAARHRWHWPADRQEGCGRSRDAA
jgi:hypothetical protein